MVPPKEYKDSLGSFVSPSCRPVFLYPIPKRLINFERTFNRVLNSDTSLLTMFEEVNDDFKEGEKAIRKKIA